MDMAPIQPESESRCPECGSNDLAFAMHFKNHHDDEDGELFQCRDCHATGAADDRRGAMTCDFCGEEAKVIHACNWGGAR
jgi:hypothetical protein